MSDGVSFEAHEYGSGNAEAVALVTGFDGKVGHLEQAARDLVVSGRDVVVYTYGTEVLLGGDGTHLPSLIQTIGTDFQSRTQFHTRRRFGGVSLGGPIAAGMQKACPNPEPGLYAATGIDAADLVMNHRLFRALVRRFHDTDTRQVFSDNEHTVDTLRELWRDIQIPPSTPFTLVLGGLDPIVRFGAMRPKVTAWKAGNPNIRMISRPLLTHTGTRKWFNDNCARLLQGI